eukprot:m.210978 g.210978  ORF g.210978 m.210978 type:complete len:58 (-) comp25331_c0_seq1:153-326(-)
MPIMRMVVATVQLSGLSARSRARGRLLVAPTAAASRRTLVIDNDMIIIQCHKSFINT